MTPHEQRREQIIALMKKHIIVDGHGLGYIIKGLGETADQILSALDHKVGGGEEDLTASQVFGQRACGSRDDLALGTTAALAPFIRLAREVVNPVEGRTPWWVDSNDWTVVFSFAGQYITLGDLRKAAAAFPEGDA